MHHKLPHVSCPLHSNAPTRLLHSGDSLLCQVLQLKELEKRGPKKGVIAQSVKDVVQSLVDDDLVLKEKIGTSVSWCQPATLPLCPPVSSSLRLPILRGAADTAVSRHSFYCCCALTRERRSELWSFALFNHHHWMANDYCIALQVYFWSLPSTAGQKVCVRAAVLMAMHGARYHAPEGFRPATGPSTPASCLPCACVRCSEHAP